MFKIVLDLLFKTHTLSIIFVFTLLCVLFFNIPFFSINKNDEFFSALDTCVSNSLLFSFIFTSYIINKFIVESMANRSFFNLNVKPNGTFAFVSISFASIFLTNAIFYSVSTILCIYFSSHRGIEMSDIIAFVHIFGFFSASVFSSLIIPLTGFFGSSNSLLLSFFIFTLLNAINFDIFKFNIFSCSDAIFLEIFPDILFIIKCSFYFVIIMLFIFFLSLLIFKLREVE